MQQNRTLLVAGVAGAVLLAAAGGYGLAKLTGGKPAGEAQPAAAAPTNVVTADAARLTAAGVTVEAVSAGSPAGEVTASARVVATPDGQAVLTAHAPGSVSRILKRLGDVVRAGETVAVIESREAATMAADRDVAQSRANLAHKRLERETSLFDQRVSPRQDLEQAQAEAEAADAEIRRARLTAGAARVARDGRSILVTSPISGRLTSAPAALGGFVQADTELFRVSDPTRIQIEASVTAADARRLAAGGRAVIEGLDGQSLPAVIRAITPSLDPETHTATVVLSIAGNPNLTPGQTVRVRLTAAAEGETGVSVPDEAVQRIESRDVVFVRTATGFKVQPVVLGERSGGRVAITSGLTASQYIAVRNAFLLKAELGKGGEEEE